MTVGSSMLMVSVGVSVLVGLELVGIDVGDAVAVLVKIIVGVSDALGEPVSVAVELLVAVDVSDSLGLGSVVSVLDGRGFVPVGSGVPPPGDVSVSVGLPVGVPDGVPVEGGVPVSEGAGVPVCDGL